MEGKMLYQNIPYVEKPLSRVVYGTGITPFWNGEDRFDLLDAAFAAGINTFDTARVYGEAEAVLGRWLEARKLHGRVVILTKGANPDEERDRITKADILDDLAMSFQRLKTNYVDIYMLHRDDPNIPVGFVVSLLNELHREGRIGAFGCSNWTWQRLKEANAYAEEHGLVPFSVCSPSYGLMECIGDPWGGSVTISGPANAPYRHWLQQTNMPVFAYSSLARGFLSGRLKSTDTDPEKARSILGFAYDEYGFPVNYKKLARAEQLAAEKGVSVPQIGYAWLMRQPLNIFGITSPGSAAHISQTVQAMHLQLNSRELQWLNNEIEEM